MIRWLSNRWNKRRTSVIEKRLKAENNRLTEELDAEKSKTQLLELEVNLQALVIRRNQLRVEREIAAESRGRDELEGDEPDLRTVG